MFTIPIIPLVARVLLAALFILAGITKIMTFAGTTGYIASKGLPAPQVLAVLTILLEICGGLCLVLGFMTRLAALALAAFAIASAVLFHNFWAMEAAQAGVNQIMFMKNLSIAGGMLMLVYFGAGPLAIDKKR